MLKHEIDRENTQKAVEKQVAWKGMPTGITIGFSTKKLTSQEDLE